MSDPRVTHPTVNGADRSHAMTQHVLVEPRAACFQHQRHGVSLEESLTRPPDNNTSREALEISILHAGAQTVY